MQRYELEDTKRSTEYILDEIYKSLDILRNYATDAGVESHTSINILTELKQKLYEFYNAFSASYEESMKKINEEEQEEK